MRVNAEFVTSVARLDQSPNERLPEIALVGRSNVGKSSMINALVGRPGLARTSNTPGRTQTLNYYRIAPEAKAAKPFFIVDMPGFGFAAVNRGKRAEWGDLIEQHINTSSMLCGIVQLVDLRHPAQPFDLAVSEWLHDSECPRLVVATKADKVAKTKVPQLLLRIAESLDVDSFDTMAFSAETGFGRDKLWRWVMDTASGFPPAP